MGTMTHSNHVMVRLEDDKGRVGWGETTTFHSVYGYDQKSLHNVLQDHLIPVVLGCDPRDLERLHHRMDQAIPYNLMAKCGIDLAAHDLIARAEEVPLHLLLGGKKRDRLSTIAVIGITENDQASQKALELKRTGYRVIKVKIGLNVEKDLERLSQIRSAVGNEVKIRVDANQGYNLESLLNSARELDELELEWLEQPLPAWDLDGLKTLTRRLETPIAVDENIYTLHDAQFIKSYGAASVINIKVVKCGGIYRAQRIARFCENEGLTWFMGGCLETSPGNAAHCHFYASTASAPLAVETGGSYYTDDIVKEPLIPEGEKIVVPEGVGLGVEIDETKLEQYRAVLAKS